MSAEKLAHELEGILLKRIQTDQLVVPTIPAVVQKVQETLREGDATVAKRATEILERDPFLAARALHVAVGAKSGGSGAAAIASALRRVWEHSVAVATLARDVLALSGHADSEAAYLAGLLHDVGKPVVASILLEAERQTTELYNRPWITSEEWVSAITSTHRAVGIA